MKSRDVIELFQWSEKAWNNTYVDFVKEIKGQFPGKHFISGNNAAKKRFKSFLETKRSIEFLWPAVTTKNTRMSNRSANTKMV